MAARSSPILVGSGIALAAFALLAQAVRDSSDWQTWTLSAVGLVALAMLAWAVFVRGE